MKHNDWVSARVYNIGYHFVWSTKYRQSALTSPIDVRLKEILLEIAHEYDFIIESMEVMPDYCHVFVVAHPKHSPSTLIKLMKGISARRLFQEFTVLKKKLSRGHLWNPS